MRLFRHHLGILGVLGVFGVVGVVGVPSLHATVPPLVVISEVLWSGTDLSASDEWVEIIAVDEPASMSGWTLTTLNTSGVETIVIRFPASAVAQPGVSIIVSRFAAEQSRLAGAPDFVTSAMSLPNTKLLLRLRDGGGTVIDMADDGVGAPLAGENSSTLRASMERVDLRSPGSLPSNWQTSTVSRGFDDGATAVFGTPGSQRTSSSDISSEPYIEPKSSSSLSSFSSLSSLQSSASSCASFDSFSIDIQGGTTQGEAPHSINVQLLNRGQSITRATCSIDFGDGEETQSCNPSWHKYEAGGSYVMTARVTNQCGTTVQQMLSIDVSGKAYASSMHSVSSAPERNFHVPPVRGASALSLVAVLPNPVGKDRLQEWVDVMNGGHLSQSLDGWSLVLGAATFRRTLGNITLHPGQVLRIALSESTVALPNDEGLVRLISPEGSVISEITWKNASEGRIYGPVIDRVSVMGRVKTVIDGDTLDVLLDETVAGLRAQERVRLIGIDAPELRGNIPAISSIAERAKNFLLFLTEEQKIVLEFDSQSRDAYGRLLAYVGLPSGESIQKTLLRQGLATVETRFPFVRRDQFLLAQAEGKEEQMGIWSLRDGESSIAVSSASSESMPVSSATTVLLVARDAISPRTDPQSSAHRKRSSSSKRSRRAAVKASDASRPSRLPRDPHGDDWTDDGMNMSPLLAMRDDHVDLLTADLLAVEELIERPGSAWVTSRNLAEPAPPSRFPWGVLGAILSVTAAGSGVAGWLLARRKKA